MKFLLVLVALLSTSASLAQTPYPPQTPFVSSLGGRGGGGGGGGVTPADACMLVGGSGVPGCAMLDPGVTFPGVTGASVGAVWVTTDVITGINSVLTIDGNQTATTGVVQLGDGDILKLGPTSTQIQMMDNTAAGFIAFLITNNSAFTAVPYQHTIYPALEGWWMVGPTATDPGGISVLTDTGDTTKGTVHAGAYAARADANAVPLFCASTRIEEVSTNVVRETCAFADGTWQSGNGTAAKPTYSFLSAGNTDNGMYLSASDEVSLSTNGTQKLVVQSNGEVGINVANPLAIFHVTGTYPQSRVQAGAGVPVVGTLMYDSGGTFVGGYAYDSTSLGDPMSFYGPGYTATGNGFLHAFTTDSTIRFATDVVNQYPTIFDGGSASATRGSWTFNADQISTADLTVQGDNEARLLFIDASTDTLNVAGGVGSSGCTFDASGNLTCDGTIAGSGSLTGSGANTQVTFWTAGSTIAGDAGMTYNSGTDSLTLVGVVEAQGGDAAATPNFTIEAGEGLYDCGANCVAVSANAVDVFTADASTTIVANDDSNVLVSDTGANGQVSINLDTTNRFIFENSGHLHSNAIGIGTVTSGSCTNETGTADSTDVRGGVTADCTAGQTIIVNFGTAYGAAPFCVASASNTAGGASVISASASTTALTITSIGAVTAGRFNWICIE